LRPILAVRSDALPKVALHPAGGRLAIARGGEISIVDVETGAAACTAPDELVVERLSWADDDKVAVVRGGGSVGELREARRCAVVSALEHPAPITAFSTRAGSRLVTAGGGEVRVWRRGQVEASFGDYTGSIQGVGIDGEDVYAVTKKPVAVV